MIDTRALYKGIKLWGGVFMDIIIVGFMSIYMDT